MKWYQEPLVHFLILGTLLFFFNTFFNPDKIFTTSKEIIVTKTKIDNFIQFWKRKYHTYPDKKNIDKMIENYIQDEILYQEALIRNLEKDDLVIKKLLVDKLKFTIHNDINISDTILKKYFNNNKEKFLKYISKIISFKHIYINTKEHKNSRSIADDIYIDLQKNPNEKSLHYRGDNFYGGNHFKNITEKDLSHYFSKSFINQLLKLPTNVWSKPIASGFGMHIIYIEKTITSSLEFNTLKEKIKNNYLIEKHQRALNTFYKQLRKNYKITIESAYE